MSPKRAVRHGLTLAWRHLMKIRHSPDQLLDVTLMPITFIVMFVFLFGNSVSGDWRSYLQYVVPGIAVQALMFASLGTALTLNTDVRKGVFDRLRSLPIARAAPLIGHVLGDLVKYVISLVLVFGFGALLGFRFHGEPLGVLAGCCLLLVFAFAVCWIATALGIMAASPEMVQGLSLVVILPFTFASNVFVPVDRVPGWLQAWIKINPVTQVSTAARGLLLGHAAGHAVAHSLLWTAGIVAVFAPVAVWAYGRSSGPGR